MKPFLLGIVGCLALLAPGSVRPLHPLVTPGPFKVAFTHDDEAFAEAFADGSGGAIGQLYESATRLKQSAKELDARVKGDLE